MNDYNKIMNIMNSIDYGFKDENGFNLINDSNRWSNEFYKFYYLLSPEELLSKKCGVCWDQVELERELFLKDNLKSETFFIYINNGKELPSHTFLTFEYDDKFYWFEHSWFDYKGIHNYSSMNDLLTDVKEKFILSHKDNCDNSDVLIYKYNKPKYHITCDEFYDYLSTQELIENI